MSIGFLQYKKINDWIIEGVFYDWLDGSFRDADVIILLDIPKRVYRFRIIRRFVKRKLGMERAKKETLSSLVALLKCGQINSRIKIFPGYMKS